MVHSCLPDDIPNDKRRAKIEQVVRATVVAKRDKVSVDYAAIERRHAELMPELGDRLRDIQAIDHAAASLPQVGQSRDDADIEFMSESLPAYNIIEAVDYGGQGRVYRAVQKATNRLVAIKVLLDGPFATRRQHDRFLREIRAVSRLKHPGIVTVYDSGSIHGRPYLVMEFVEGLPIDLHALADDLDVRQRIELFLEACSAVSAAHAKGIVHRDLKPGNIMVNSEGRVRLLDFGLAKDVSKHSGDSRLSNLSVTGQRVGTARYSSPEQIGGGELVGVRSDIYTLGVVLFELITGTMPYVRTGTDCSEVSLILNSERMLLREALKKFPPPGRIAPKDVGRDLEIIVCNAMEPDRARRFATVEDLADDLKRFLRSEPIKVRPGLYYRLKTGLMAYRAKFSVTVALAAVALASMVGMTMAWRSARESERNAQEVARIAQAGLQIGSFVREASVHRYARKTDQAIEMLLRAVALSEFVSTDDPLVCRQVYSAHHELAVLYMKTKRVDEARHHCDVAIMLAQVLRNTEPENLEWYILEGYSHNLRGRLAYLQESWKEARSHFYKALMIREEVADRESNVLHRQSEVGHTHVWLGKVYRQLGRLVESVQQFEASRAIDIRILATEPDDVDHAIRLSRTDMNLGGACMSYGTVEGNARAIAWFDVAQQRLIQLQQTDNLQQHLAHDISELLAVIQSNVTTINVKASPRT